MPTAHFRSRGRHETVCKRKVPKGIGGVKGSLCFLYVATIVVEIYSAPVCGRLVLKAT